MRYCRPQRLWKVYTVVCPPNGHGQVRTAGRYPRRQPEEHASAGMQISHSTAESTKFKTINKEHVSVECGTGSFHALVMTLYVFLNYHSMDWW